MSRALVEGVVLDVNDVHEQRWELGERLTGGFQSGAWKLTAVDGSAGVLKIATSADWSRQVVRAAPVVAAVRRSGYPTPAWLLTGMTASGIGYQVQEMVPGTTIDIVDLEHAQSMIHVIELQTSLDPDPERCWSDFLTEELTVGFNRLCAPAVAGPLGSELIHQCDQLLCGLDEIQWPRTDMVHGDFRPGNVLFERQRVSGVIDIEAIGSGPRAFDYATLLSYSKITPDALECIVRAGSHASGPAVLRACVSQAFLDLVRFVSRNPNWGDTERDDCIRILCKRAEIIDRLTSK